MIGRSSWVPSWGLITTKQMELRKRKGLMVMVALLTIGLPVLVIGIHLIFHVVNSKTYGPAGSPGLFQGLTDAMAEFGFIMAAVLGASAGTTDLSDGVFRHLVVTGRSRIALYLARIPAGLSIVLPLVGVAFAFVCLITSYAGVAQPTTVSQNGVSVPVHLDEAQLKTYLLQHPRDAPGILASGPVKVGPGGSAVARAAGRASERTAVRLAVDRHIGAVYAAYASDEQSGLNPVPNEMLKIGLWLELEVLIGFVVGLGLGSLIGQRTVSTILMIVLEIIITPILAATTIPYFLNGQRLVVGIAMDQLRPAGLAASASHGGPGHRLFGGRGALGIPSMPTWAMVAVIVGWIVVWSVIGAWRMATRDA